MSESAETKLSWVITGLKDVKSMAKAIERLRDAQSGLLKVLGKDARQMGSTTKMTAALDKWGRATSKIEKNTKAVNKSLTKTRHVTDMVAKSTGKWRDSMSSIYRIAAGTLLSRGIGKFLQLMGEGTRATIELGIRIGEIRTIAQETDISFRQWGHSIRMLSDAFGANILDIAEGHYQTLSNQIAKGAEVTNFMADAQKFALVSVSSTTDAVGLLSATLNSYGESASRAGEHSAILFKMIELGRVRAQDIASTFGQVTMVGAQLGIQLEELAAGMATLTRKGVTPSMAMTGLRNIMLKLLRPTEHMKEIFEQWGVATGSMAIETYGFIGVMRKLAKHAEESGDPLNEIAAAFGRIRAIVGAAGLTGAFAEYEKDFEAITDGAESFAEALERIKDTDAFKITRELTRLKNIFIQDIGEKAVKAMVNLSEAAGGFAKRLQQLVNMGKYFIAAGLAYTITKIGFAMNAAGFSATRLLITWRALSAWALIHPAIIAAAFFTLGYKLGEIFFTATKRMKALSNEWTQHFIENSKRRLVAIAKESKRMADEFTKGIKRQKIELNGLIALLDAFYNKIQNRGKRQLDLMDKLRAAMMASGKSPLVKESFLMNQLADYRKFLWDSFEAKDWTAVDLYIDKLEQLKKDLESLNNTLTTVNRRPGIIEMHGGRITSRGRTTIRLDTTKATGDIEEAIWGLRQKEYNLSIKEGDVRGIAAIDFKSKIEDMREYANIVGDYETTIKNITKNQEDELKQANKMQTYLETTAKNIQLNLGKTDLGWGSVMKHTGESLKKWDRDLDMIVAKLDFFEKRGALLTEQGSAVMESEVNSLLDRLEDFKEKGTRPQYWLNWPTDIEAKLESMAASLRAFSTFRNNAEELKEIVKGLRDNIPGIQKTLDQIGMALTETTSGLKEFANIGLQEQNIAKLTAERLLETLRGYSAELYNMGNAALRLSGMQGTIKPPPKILTDPGSWKGGYASRFAGGGSVANDTVPAMLSVGEVVLNREASRRLFPQFVAANSGAARFNSGGVVNNNSVGDINVSVKGGDSSEMTVRNIANSLRREVRRGIVRLN